MPSTGPLLRDAIAAALGVDATVVRDLRPAGGGDVSRASTAVVDGQRVFVKHLEPPIPGLLAAEAASLRWLAEGLRGHDLSVVEVLGVSDERDGHSNGPEVLVLSFVDSSPPRPDHDERLGRGLAALHQAGATSFGASWPGFLGRLPVPNGPEEDWPALLGARLFDTAVRADRDGHLPPRTLEALARLRARLPELLGPKEPPARLHGDLWAGNAMSDASGAPVLIDPAAYGGHREVDLAMMRLFGGFSQTTFAAYQEVAPLADDHDDRVGLLHLHPLLVHAAMFGAGYGARARAVVERYQ